MSAFFGINERNARGFIDSGMVCLQHAADGNFDLHAIVSPIKNEDIVFIESCTPESSLQIKAVGVVRSDFASRSDADVCLPVDWVWQGEKVLENVDEVLALCGCALYEEHNILVQREIIDLLPQRYQLPPEW